jgi:hypothetical protein
MSGALGEGELGHQIVRHSFAGLVTVEEIVAEGLDDVIERAGDVGDAGLAQQRVERAHDAARGADLRAVTGGSFGGA